jgi:Carboxypeptidase regulatory-like domain
MLRLVACAILPLCVYGQRGDGREEVRPAVVSGSVLSDASGEPLPRAQILLKPIEAGLSAMVAETDEHGKFVFFNLKPGNYVIQARREGYLPSSNAARGRVRMPPIVTVEAGARWRDLNFHLRRWSVITGKIKFDTAEPGVGIAVQVLRKRFVRNRRAWVVVANAHTNDLGEYRIHGLPGGDYFVAAAYSREVPPDAVEQESVDEEGHALPRMAYATTFYPSALKLSEAVAVHADPGQEIGGVDIFLKPVPTVRLRGRVINGADGTILPGGAVSLRRTGGMDGESINVPITVRPYLDGFEIRGVTSGPYVLTADTEEKGLRYSARYPLIVTDSPIDNIDVVLAASRAWPVRVRLDDDTAEFKPEAVRVSLEPRSELNPIAAAEPDHNGALRALVALDESYDVVVTNMPPDYYLKSIKVGNEERLGSAVNGSAASGNTPLELTLATNGGRVAGRAYADDGRPASGATIALVPDAGPSRPQWYRFGSADEYGVFQIRGLAPGRYTAFAFYDDPPCEFYDPDELASCRSKGRDVAAAEGSQAIVELPLAR